MRENFDSQLQEINLQMLKMAAKVEEIIALSTKSLQEKNEELAKKAIKLDPEINEAEQQTQRMCINLLLMQQPVYADNLRSVSAAFKILTDLERMGDQARDISILNLELLKKDGIWNIELISDMAAHAAQMVSLCVVAYSNRDVKAAQKVIESDDVVDELFYEVKNQLVDFIIGAKDKAAGVNALDTLMVAKYFERIADHAQNVAEWVIYLVTGKEKKQQKHIDF